MFDILNLYRETIQHHIDEWTYEEFKQKMLETFIVDDIAGMCGLPFKISGQYDSTAIDTVLRQLYDGEIIC